MTKIRPESRLGRVVWFAAFLILVSPTVINYSRYEVTWDEAYYLDRIICVNHAVYDFSLHQLNQCLINTRKGPILDVVDLPWGRAGGTEKGIGLAFVGLAVLIWLLVFTTYQVCLQSGISPHSLLLAASTIALTPFLRTTGGAMMTDILVGWCVALALMLIPLEYIVPSHGFWRGVLRGLLWGFVIDIGMLSKVTFCFFLGSVGAALLVIRQDYSGKREVCYAAIGAALGALPAIIVWRFYWLNFLGFAKIAAWGDIAKLWDVPGMTPQGYLWRYFSQLGLALIPLCIQFVLYARAISREGKHRIARLIPFCIVLAYLCMAAGSHNRDPRFAIPVMISMPFCLTWTSVRKAGGSMVVPAPIFGLLAVCTLFSIPMIRRPELAPIERAGNLLSILSYQRTSAREINVEVADDGPKFNINTFMLASQISADLRTRVKMDTLVYDAINKRSVEDGLKRIDTSDFVLFLKPGLEPGPSWSRVYDSQYRAYVEKVGVPENSNFSSEFDVYAIRPSNVQ